MSPQEKAIQGEEIAVNNSQFVTNVKGKPAKKTKGKIGKISATMFITGVFAILLVVIFVATPTMVDAIMTRLVEETDTQYADAVQSKALVFQQALEQGDIPSNTAERLEQAGVTVGYLDGDTFVASNVGERKVAAEDFDEILFKNESGANTPLSLKMGDKIISADNFYYEVNHDVKLYSAFTDATYSRAAYYYDDSAKEVLQRLGVAGNVLTSGEDLDEAMEKLLGNGNIIHVNDETWHWWPKWRLISPTTSPEVEIYDWEKKTDVFNCSPNGTDPIAVWEEPIVEPVYDEKTGRFLRYEIVGYTPIYGDYGCDGSEATYFMRTVAQSNMSEDEHLQTVYNTTDSLKASDTVSKERRSMLIYVGFMQSISMMKAGYGGVRTDVDKIASAFTTMGAVTGGSKVNEVMNKLYETSTVQVVDMNGNVVEVTGSAVESPSMFAILAGGKVDAEDTASYSSDRVLKIVENQMGLDEMSNDTVRKTVASTSSMKTGSTTVGKYTQDVRDYTPSGEQIQQVLGENYNHGNYQASDLDYVAPVIQDSLYNNSFKETTGYVLGELLAEGAVNVGKELSKASGAAAGDKEAATAYMKLTSEVLAMDREADRLNRSPLDVTSKNTFLGSIVYKFGVSAMRSGSVLNKLATVSRTAASAMGALMPSAMAEDGSNELYLSVFGDCETLDKVGAVGSATCSMVATFDTDTYEVNGRSIYDDGDFKSFVSSNVSCDNDGKCRPTEGSDLAKYINYNEMRTTPFGITDGGIMDAVEEAENTGFFTKLFNALKSLFGIIQKVDESVANIPKEATGEEFVDNDSNANWDSSYKYAQRYISLARATENLRQYDGDQTAYNFEYFGIDNPIVGYINEHFGDAVAKD